MSDSTVWWILAGLLVSAELLTGTFHLLMLAIGLAAGAVAARCRQSRLKRTGADCPQIPQA